MQSFFDKTSNHPGDSAPLSPDLVPCNFWLFPKLKSPLKGKGFQTLNEIQENTMGQLMVTGRTVWGPKVPTLKGTEVSLSYIQCFLYLVFSSIYVSNFHIAWLNTCWTNLIYSRVSPHMLGLLSDNFWFSDEPHWLFLTNSQKQNIYVWVSSMMFLLFYQIWTKALTGWAWVSFFSLDIVGRVSITQATWN